MRTLQLITCLCIGFASKGIAVDENKTLIEKNGCLDHLLPSSLVMKASPLPSHQLNKSNDRDFHISKHESNVAIIWVKDSMIEGDYLCGAICPIDQGSSLPDGNLGAQLESVIHSDHKMVTRWTSSVSKGDMDLLSSIAHRELEWEAVSDVDACEKWSICGVQKKQGIPIRYFIKKGNETIWVSKEEALELSLEGKLPIVIPQDSN